MNDYNPDHYRFRRSGNLKDEDWYRRHNRRAARVNFAIFVVCVMILIWIMFP